MWLARFTRREKEELQVWWDERKRNAERLGKTPVQWKPKGQLRWPKRKKKNG